MSSVELPDDCQETAKRVYCKTITNSLQFSIKYMQQYYSQRKHREWKVSYTVVSGIYKGGGGHPEIMNIKKK